MTKKKFLQAKENEIAKAGRLVFDAIFGDDKELEQRLTKELDEETTAPPSDPPGHPGPRVIDVPAYLVVQCSGCGRDAVLPAHVDARALELVGWKRDARSSTWRCPMCGGAPVPGRPR